MDDYGLFLLRTGGGKTVSEKEEADTEEQCSGHRDRPHSRDKAGVGAPKHDNRRKRIMDFADPDLQEPAERDVDLSKNYKSAANPALNPALKSQPEESADFKGMPGFVSRPLQSLARRVNSISPAFQEEMSEQQHKILAPYRRAVEQSKSMSRDDRKAYVTRAARKVANEVEIAVNHFDKASTMTFGNPKTAAEDIAEAWGIEGNFFARAGIVEALKEAAMKSDLPASVKVPVMSGAGGRIAKPEAVKALLKKDEKKTHASEDDVKRFVAIVTAHGILRKNPSMVKAKDLVDPKQLTKIMAQVSAVQDLNKVMSSWHDMVSRFKPGNSDIIDVSRGEWDAVLSKLNSFMRGSKALQVDPSQVMSVVAEDYAKVHGKVPSELRAVLEGFGVPPKSFGDSEKSSRGESKGGGGVGQELGIDFEEMSVDDAFMDSVTAKLEAIRKDEKSREDRAKPVPSPAKGARGLDADLDRDDDNKDSRRPMVRGLSTSTSYGDSSHSMIKTSTYHGVVNQGHPTDSAGTSSYNYDKRYFGKEHYDSIIAAAKKLLDEDWLKYGWGESSDVPVRAALDLAVCTADGGLYQSRIDANVYNMLLNRLAGWDYDMFSETILSGQKTRKAASMATSPARAILKIADDLRATRPDMAVQIIKNLHELVRVSTGAPGASAAAPEPAHGHGQGQSTDFEKGVAEEERKLIEQMVNQVADQYAKEGRDVSDDQKRSMVEKIRSMLEQGLDPKTGDVKFASLIGEARALLALARIASIIPRYKGQLPAILAAANKLKDKKSAGKGKDGKKPAKGKDDKKPAKKPAKKEDKEEAPKPAIPSKKVKDSKVKGSGKKVDTSCNSKSKRKASVVLSLDDVNW